MILCVKNISSVLSAVLMTGSKATSTSFWITAPNKSVHLLSVPLYPKDENVVTLALKIKC